MCVYESLWLCIHICSVDAERVLIPALVAVAPLFLRRVQCLTVESRVVDHWIAMFIQVNPMSLLVQPVTPKSSPRFFVAKKNVCWNIISYCWLYIYIYTDTSDYIYVYSHVIYIYISYCWLCLYIYIISIFKMVKLSVYPCSQIHLYTPLPLMRTEMSPFKTSLTSPTWYGSGDGLS